MRRRRLSAPFAGMAAALGGLFILGIGTANSVSMAEPVSAAPSAALARIGARNERASDRAAAQVRANVQENLQIADAEFARSQQGN